MTRFENLALLFSTKKQQQQTEADSLKYGYKINDKIVIGENHIFLNLFIRATLVYLCIIGSVDAYMSAFNLPYDMLKIMVNFAVITLLLVLIQYNNITRLLGYIGFIYLLTEYMGEKITVVRSGIVAIINMSYELIRIKFSLPTVDGFTEAITDRSLTVTTAIIVVGCFFIVAFWEVAGRSMNLIVTAILTFTALSLGLYFDGVPSTLSIISFGTIWLFIGIVKFNSKQEVSSKKLPYKYILWKNSRYYHKHSDGKTMLQLLILSFVFVLVSTTLVKPVFNKTVFEKTIMPSQLKESSDKMLKNIMIVGFSRYKGFKVNGRISNGQLGNYSSINPDYLPDLDIEFLPVSTENIYLKSYIGSIYSSEGWSNIEKNPYTNQRAMTMTADALSENNYPVSRMRVKNRGVITDRPLLPYYTDLDSVNLPIRYETDDILNGRFNIGEVSELNYYPYTDLQTQQQIVCNDKEINYRKYVYDNYLQLPEENKELISQLCIKQGWNRADKNVAEKIADYFQEEFTYTLNPGLVPWKTDFVNYFLFENKEGVCAHFASAGTLIFRAMGIPARYVEGYALPFSYIYEGEAIENKDMSYWYAGDLKTIYFSPVKVTLSDYNAHAWVEIYKDGFGWVPVELTPVANPEDEENKKSDQEIWTEFFSKFLESMKTDGETAPLIPPETMDEISETLPFFGYITGGIIILLYLFAISIKHIKRQLDLLSKNRQRALISTYSHLVKILVYLKYVNENPGFKEISEYFNNTEEIFLVEKALYSKDGLSDEQQNIIINKISKFKKELISKQSIVKKIILYIKI